MALQKARIRAFATEVFFTAARAEALGHCVSPDCVFCGARDTVFHRLWECQRPEVLEARVEAVDQDIIDVTLSAILWEARRLLRLCPIRACL
eukprot:5929114-Pyramimonas_sp.AAC.1